MNCSEFEGVNRSVISLEYMKVKQAILEYNAVFEPAEEGGFNVSFPALPGCVTFGKTFEESQRMAGEVLELWLEELADQGIDFPETTGLSFVQTIVAPAPRIKKRTKKYASTHR